MAKSKCRSYVLATAVIIVSVLVIVTVMNTKQEILQPRIQPPLRHLTRTQSTAAEETSPSNDVIMTTDEMSRVLYGDHPTFHRKGHLDSGYLNFIRSHLAKPSPYRPLQLNDKSKVDFSQYGQSYVIDKLLKSRRGGYFVECGAVDGELFSNTLYLELERNWTGLLIEANVNFHRQLLAKNRKAIVFGGCLSPSNESRLLMFNQANVLGGVADQIAKSHVDRIYREKLNESIQPAFCVPLGDLLAAVGVNHVDFLSLDVEGAELAILKTIDFTRLRIDAMMLEWNNGHANMLGDIRRLLISDTGLYREVGVLSNQDVLFARIDLI